MGIYNNNTDYEEKEYNPNPEMEKQFDEEERIYRAELDAEKNGIRAPFAFIENNKLFVF